MEYAQRRSWSCCSSADASIMTGHASGEAGPCLQRLRPCLYSSSLVGPLPSPVLVSCRSTLLSEREEPEGSLVLAGLRWCVGVAAPRWRAGTGSTRCVPAARTERGYPTVHTSVGRCRCLGSSSGRCPSRSGGCRSARYVLATFHACVYAFRLQAINSLHRFHIANACWHLAQATEDQGSSPWQEKWTQS